VPAYYHALVDEFLKNSRASVLESLTTGSAADGFDISPDQHEAWVQQVDILQVELAKLRKQHPSIGQWGILLEYAIGGRASRLDVVLLEEHGVIPIEFKVGTAEFASAAKWQLREYCWNLRDFHPFCRNQRIAPILVATGVVRPPIGVDGFQPEDNQGLVLQLQAVGTSTLGQALERAIHWLSGGPSRSFVIGKWKDVLASPAPSIIEAAQDLYRTHTVSEINSATADDADKTISTIADLISEAKDKKDRRICFVTGVPGAGKTLVGMRIAYDKQTTDTTGAPACFATGNGPLLKVLKAALTRNRSASGAQRREVRHEISAPVQSVHDFGIGHLASEGVPAFRVVVFDEAQRVWTAKHLENSLKGPRRQRDESIRKVVQQIHGWSEPDILLEVMERLDWCVVIALVGGGQEINTGEAGLSEWGKSIAKRHSKWRVWASPEALRGDAGSAGQVLFNGSAPKNVEVSEDKLLHLSVTRRSPRAQVLTEWVNCVLDGRASAAAKLFKQLAEYPILLTRDLEIARNQLREFGAGKRFGLVASSGALRLRAHGVEVRKEFRDAIDYADWFLNDVTDFRSSNGLEIAATEFDCQGLELDWTCVCWGGDFVRDGENTWHYLQLRARKWTNAPSSKTQFILNKYRVLLTRARFGMVIFVPPGNAKDDSLSAQPLDATAEYLKKCGLSEI
jgi:schlafen family protein